MKWFVLSAALLVVLAQRAAAAVVDIDLGNCQILDTTNEKGETIKKMENCDWTGWLTGAIPLAIPLVIGILCFVFCFFFYCGRFCCNCCGGTYPDRDNFCCVPKEMPSHHVENPYEPSHIKGCKFCSVVLALIAAVGGIVLVVGLSKEMSAYDKAFQGASYTADYANQQVAKFSICMKVDPEPPGCAGPQPADVKCYKLDYDLPTLATNITKETDKIKKEIDDSKEDADNIVGKIKPLLFVAGLVPFLIILLGVVSAMCNIRRCMPMILMLFAFFFAFLLGTGLTIEAFVSKVAEDFCPELNKYKDGDMYNIIKTLVDDSCDQKDFDDNKKEVQDAIDNGAEQGCTQLLDVCTVLPQYDQIKDPAKIFYSPICTSSAATLCKNGGLDYVNSLISNTSDPNAPKAKPGTDSQACASGIADCTVKQCAIDCVNADAKNQTGEAVSKMAEGYDVKLCYTSHIEPVLNCDSLFLESAVEPQIATCDDLRSGATMCTAGCALLFVAIILSLPVQAHGAKVWQPAEPKHSFINPDEDGMIMDGPQKETSFQPFL